MEFKTQEEIDQISKNFDDAAFPQKLKFPVSDGHVRLNVKGLTKREYFAAMAIQGVLSAQKDTDLASYSGVASEAVSFADALIKALNDQAGG